MKLIKKIIYIMKKNTGIVASFSKAAMHQLF